MRTSTKQQPLLTRAAAMLLLAVLMLAAVPQKAGAQTPATIGGIEYNSVGGYYEINEPDDLRDLATYVNGTGTYRDNSTETTPHTCSGLKFKMTDDITFTHDTDWDDDTSTENNFKAIGCYYNYDDRYFRGDFDGAGHTISGIRIHRSGSDDADDNQGIFGQTDGANIHGLRLADARITGYGHTGGIVGYNEGTVTDCHVASNVCIHAVQSNADYHGGIVGSNEGTVENCTSASTLTILSGKTGCMRYGAIAGYNGGTLRDNLAIGATVPAARNNRHGAIVGRNGGILQRNYYTACKVASENVTPSGVGCENADVATNDGAVPAVLTQNENTYTISNTGGWDVFCYLLANNAKGYFTGKTVELANNITVTWMAGSSGHEFTGTFDGDGHTLTVSYENTKNTVYTAPFSYVDGATIQNLIVGGTITGTSYRAAGIIGETGSTLSHITNCVSSVDISSGRYTAGFSGGGLVEIEGCVFNGKIVGTNMSGGFIGYSNGAQVIKNSLFAPQDGSSISGGTFYYNGGGDVTPVNCYYTAALGTPQGKQALTHEAVSAVGEPIATYNVSGISIYGNGVQYGSTFYYDPERNFLRTVEGHNNEDGGWVFIASPLAGSIAPSEVQNLFPSAGETSNDYDLYRFNQSDPNGNEWQNWKATTEQNHPDFTSLVNGQGYLYANSEDVTLVFTGTPYEGDGVVSLAYETTNTNQNMWGWNLVGNPFAVGATSSQPYYRMNDEGSALKTETETTPVAAMEGVFVKATGEFQTVTFTAQTRGSEKRAAAALHIKVGSPAGAGTLDNAILRFDDGQTLEKFSFREGSTKLYIPQGGKDYAVVNVGGDDPWHVTTEIPVNFKAAENGTYTISVHPENVGMGYLHLIDNLTGADIDLLTPSGITPPSGGAGGGHGAYTFTANTTDYESRFKLVFSAIEDADSDADVPFAFVSNGEIIINDADAGNATLQVIDVTGRVVRAVGLSQCGSRTTTTGMTAGVYVLRLINGDEVRTQKIVIE